MNCFQLKKNQRAYFLKKKLLSASTCSVVANFDIGQFASLAHSPSPLPWGKGEGVGMVFLFSLVHPEKEEILLAFLSAPVIFFIFARKRRNTTSFFSVPLLFSLFLKKIIFP